MRTKVMVLVLVSAAATAAVALIAESTRRWKRRKEYQLKKTQSILRKLARDCATPVSKLWEVADALVCDMRECLVSQEASKLDMLVSYTTFLPNGDEEGQYYGLNWRGNNFLILSARHGGNNEPISELRRKEVTIPSNVLAGTSQELFDYIAVELAKFISEHPADSDTAKKLGVTLSYPVEQGAASYGCAIKWKSFSADDTVKVGKALVNDINQSLERLGVKKHVFAMVDETVGNLAGGRYYNKDVVAAVTLSLRSNAAYVEPVEAVPKWSSPSPISGELVINTEWGNFNCSKLPVTEFDASLDSESSNPGNRIFGKLISAMYLGEIVRRVILKMAKEAALFGDILPPKLATPWLLKTPDMAAMHQDTSEDRQVVGEKLKAIFEVCDSSPMAREVVAEVCDIVAERAARLTGAGIVGIIKKLGRIENKRSVVIVEGGLYEHYRIFRNYLHSSIWEMLGNELSDNVVLEHSHGGSGAGSIFLAACQTHNTNS